MHLAEHKLLTRCAVHLVSLAHVLGADKLPGYRWLYESFYPWYKLWFDGGVLKFIEKHSSLFHGGHLIDLGANIGVVSQALSKVVTAEFRVVAVEPDPTSFESLLRNLSDKPACLTVNAAVGAENGDGVLWLHPFHRADHRLQVPADEAVRRKPCKVRLMKLDSLIDELRLDPQNVRFVKMDLQGGEWNALLGMENLLRRAADVTVCLEFSPSLWRSAGVGAGDVFQWFHQLGYSHLYRLLDSGKPRRIQSWAHLLSSGSCDLLVRRTAL